MTASSFVNNLYVMWNRTTAQEYAKILWKVIQFTFTLHLPHFLIEIHRRMTTDFDNFCRSSFLGNQFPMIWKWKNFAHATRGRIQSQPREIDKTANDVLLLIPIKSYAKRFLAFEIPNCKFTDSQTNESPKYSLKLGNGLLWRNLSMMALHSTYSDDGVIRQEPTMQVSQRQ
jgi:hypothetical protein